MLKLIRRIVAKTAAYTIKWPYDQPFQEFTNRGATGAVALTLPTPSRALLGVSYRYRAVADYAISFVGATAGDLLTKNDIAADSIAASTAGEIIGALIEAVCVENVEGTFKWAVTGLAVGHTYTVV